MKSIEFDESQLGSLQEIADSLFDASGDPRSNWYKRILIRPKVNWLKIALNCICPVFVTWGLQKLLFYLNLQSVMVWVITVSTLFVYLSIRAKKCVLCLICIYQRYAPDSIRNKCRFEPSCSQYMALAIKKYGLAIGIKKGIRRLKRCNPSDGGYDFP